jgi:hypothetical protein
MRVRVLLLTLLSVVIFGFVLVAPSYGDILSVSQVRIEPTGYEDPSTHEWKGSFWVVTATTDTKASFLFYEFNQSQSEYFGKNKIDNKTIVPQATIKITITPRQPYWEIPLQVKSYMVYPKTYGMWMNKILDQPNKLSSDSVPALNVTVLESGTTSWSQHTPFDVTIEKVGNNAFTKTVHVDTIGGTESVVITNPADTSEKLMITNLGQLGTGYGQPLFNTLTIFNKTNSFVVFEGENVRKAIPYGRNQTTGGVDCDECYAFYWFGGGNIYTTHLGGKVECFDDDKSPAHYTRKNVLVDVNSPVDDQDFAGSYRNDDPLDYRVYPIAASIFDDNNKTNPYGLSLVNYLKKKVSSEIDLDIWGQGWTITTDNKLRISMPGGAASSLITIKVSTELADSVVYQPIVGYGKIEQCFWNSSKTEKSSIIDKDVAILKVKQSAPSSSKLTVTPSVPANIPVSVTPQKDSAIIDPNSVHTFQFEVSNLGPPTKLNSTITFTVTNDLGTTTDNQTLEFELIPRAIVPGGNPKPWNPTGDPLFLVLVAVIAVTVITGVAYGLRARFLSRKKTK